LYYSGGEATFEDLAVTDNTVSSSGTQAEASGALFVQNGTFDLAGLSVYGNVVSVPYVTSAGASFETTTLSIANAIIDDNEAYGVSVTTAGAAIYDSDGGTLRNVIVTGNIADGASVDGSGLLFSESACTLENATITGNIATATGPGSTISSPALVSVESTAILTNLSVTGNTATSATGSVTTGGVYFGEGDVITYVDSWGNSVSDWSTDLTGIDGNISADPTYTNITVADSIDWNLRPLAGSPLIDAGDPSLLDPNGSLSDIGAWGGPGAAGW
jgi:hypothetical protein